MLPLIELNYIMGVELDDLLYNYQPPPCPPGSLPMPSEYCPVTFAASLPPAGSVQQSQVNDPPSMSCVTVEFNVLTFLE